MKASIKDACLPENKKRSRDRKMPSTRKMKSTARELRSLRHRTHLHLYDQKAERRRLRLLSQYRRLKALESGPMPTKAESEKA
nr:hypothetical protein [Candidatus Njordarchaeum guaymaensis]